VESVIDADPIASAVRAFMAARTVWTGTASDLLGALSEAVGERVAKSKTWPDSPRALAGRLRRAATFLRKIRIEIGFEREGRARTRMIHITNAPEKPVVQPSAPSASSTSPIHAGIDVDDNFRPSSATPSAQDDKTPHGKPSSALSSAEKHSVHNALDDADDADDIPARFSGDSDSKSVVVRTI